jgi:hypothetical protein
MSQIKAGLVSVTNGSATVVGNADADWSDVVGGEIFTIQGSGVWFDVLSAAFVTDHWELTLATPYSGATAAGQAYAITTSFTPELSIPYPDRGDVETASIMKRAMLTVDSKITTISPGSFVALFGEDSQSATFTFGDNFTIVEGASPYPHAEITLN